MSRWQEWQRKDRSWEQKGIREQKATLAAMGGLYAASPRQEHPDQLEFPGTAKVALPAKGRGRPPKPLDPNAPAPKRKRKINQTLTERFEQEKVVVHATKEGYPFFAIPNASRRTFWEAMIAKKSGMKPGVLDMCFPVPMHGYGGLYIEMKRIEGGVVSTAQHYWLALLRENNYRAEVAHGAQQAIGLLDEYFAGWKGVSAATNALLDVFNEEKEAKAVIYKAQREREKAAKKGARA